MALIPCVKCNSTGGIPDPLNPELTIECPECRGVGQRETDWVGTINQLRKLVDEAEPILKSIEPKIDDIIAEQASQRIDLTAALTQIWNKVKDL